MQKMKSGLAMAGFLILLGACGGNDDAESRARDMEAQAQKYGIDADITVNEAGEVDTVTVNTLGGGQVGRNLQLPTDFPNDVPIPPGYQIMSVSPAPQGGFMVQAMTDDDIETILATLREQFSGEGWTESSADQTSPQMSRIGFEKGNRMSGLNLIDSGSQVAVQIVTMEKPR